MLSASEHARQASRRTSGGLRLITSPQGDWRTRFTVRQLQCQHATRLLCGDSTKAEDVERLMAGAKAEMLWADPPFGINYTGHGKSKDGRANKFEAIEGDDVPRSEWLANCLPASGAIYVKTTWSVLEFWNHAVSGVCDLRSHIVWDRCSHSAGDVNNGYATQSEIILFGSIGKHSISRFDTDVWRIPRATTGAPENRTGHPYESPVQLLVRAIENSLLSGAIVLDPFIGSGTCLIAAEQLGRKCYGMEISPAYCDVIVKRWETLTGRQATLEGGNDPAEYEFAYHKEKGYNPVTVDNLSEKLTLTPREYKAEHGDTDGNANDIAIENKMLEAMQIAAGITPKSKPITDPELAHFVNLSKR